MESKFNYQENQPTLYLIPTPIGNLEDITIRSLNILKKVEVIYAEDTRVTRKLLNYYQIEKPLFSLHEYNEIVKTNEVLRHLNNGQSVGIVSDAGMPLVSDPGIFLVKSTIEAKKTVVALPGANALLPALAMSGMKTHPFVFFGFLDTKTKKRKEELKRIEYYPETLIFYEAIHRINKCLKDMYEILGNRKFVIAREITKKFEEIIRGTLCEYESVGELKGELVIVLEGYQGSTQTEISIVEQVDYFIASGFKKTEAMKKVSEMTNIPKNKIYEEYLRISIKED